MRRQSRAEPKRPYLVAADALVPQPQLDHVREQLRNRARLDELDLTATNSASASRSIRYSILSSLPLI